MRTRTSLPSRLQLNTPLRVPRRSRSTLPTPRRLPLLLCPLLLLLLLRRRRRRRRRRSLQGSLTKTWYVLTCVFYLSSRLMVSSVFGLFD
ncbi:hypothetical protein B0H14DRAFT_2796231 [Mycena olivaceomarginata]|nr:hypothetical protein B0H14DRAFT_2796231 [Mycena olivaceomarginata]